MTWILVIVAGYALGYPAFAWAYADLRRYPRQLWSAASHNPYPWRQATVIAYVALGIPVIVVAATWRVSATRRELRAIGHPPTDRP
jgi:hypothetical protein